MTHEIASMVTHIPWFAWIAITAIVTGSLTGMLQIWFRHAERMAMIRHGMNPDALKPEPEDELV